MRFEMETVGGGTRAFMATASVGIDALSMVDVAARTAYVIGLEVGLQVALEDMAAARRLRTWTETHLLDENVKAIAGRDDFVGILTRAAIADITGRN